MDEKLVKMIADVGPHAKDALESYVTLQWAYFWAGCGASVLIAIVAVFLIYIWISPELDKEIKQ